MRDSSSQNCLPTKKSPSLSSQKIIKKCGKEYWKMAILWCTCYFFDKALKFSPLLFPVAKKCFYGKPWTEAKYQNVTLYFLSTKKKNIFHPNGFEIPQNNMEEKKIKMVKFWVGWKLSTSFWTGKKPVKHPLKKATKLEKYQERKYQKSRKNSEKFLPWHENTNANVRDTFHLCLNHPFRTSTFAHAKSESLKVRPSLLLLFLPTLILDKIRFGLATIFFFLHKTFSLLTFWQFHIFFPVWGKNTLSCVRFTRKRCFFFPFAFPSCDFTTIMMLNSLKKREKLLKLCRKNFYPSLRGSEEKRYYSTLNYLPSLF